jgi:hypothetical protein
MEKKNWIKNNIKQIYLSYLKPSFDLGIYIIIYFFAIYHNFTNNF